MERKKLFTRLMALMVLSVVLIIAGCSSGGSGGEEGSSGSSNSDDVVVDIFQFKVEFKEQFEDLVKKYEAENPGVKIKVQTVGGGNDYFSALKTAMASGDEPDVFNVEGPSHVELYRDYLADVSDTDTAKAALPGTLVSVEDGEEILGLPFNQEGYGLIYNKEIFDQAGIDPEAIKTYEDLEAAVKTLDSKKAELGIDSVFALAAKELWTLNHEVSTFIASDFNNDIQEVYNADTVPFERGDELKRMIDLLNDYSVQPVLSLDYSQQVEQLFSMGKVAMIRQGNWVYQAIHDLDPELAENNIGMIPVPVEGLEGQLPVGVAMYWSVNKNADEKVQEAAKDFLDWMYMSEEGKEAVLNDFKFIPAYEGYDTDLISDPLSRDVYKYASTGDTIAWTFTAAPAGWSDNHLGPNLQRYINGDIDWEEALNQARKGWEDSRK